MRSFFLRLIRLYQRYLSFDKGILRFVAISPFTCRFAPSCSEYTYQAVEKYGILHGSLLGIKRIVRCRPGSSAGEDPLT